MNQQQKTIAIVSSGILTAVGIYFLFIHKFKSKLTGWQILAGKKPEEEKGEEKKAEEPAPPTHTKQTTWKNEKFPLTTGMKGEKIKALQAVAGLKADGLFGSDTARVVKTKGYELPLTELSYDAFLNKRPAPKVAPPSPTPPAEGKKLYAAHVGVPVYVNIDDTIPYRLSGSHEYLGTYAGSKRNYWGSTYVIAKRSDGKMMYVSVNNITYEP